MVKENLKQVLNRIEAAVPKNRTGKVNLIAVSKTKPISAIKEAYDCGIRDFGENRVQEIIEKYDQLPLDIRWHMIGHLQRNKVKYIIDKVALIHSVDSFRLAEEISKEAVKRNKTMDILIEVNIAAEESKFGVSTQDLEYLIRQVSPLPGVKIRGLMTVAPFVTSAEENRQYFRTMKQLSVDITTKNIDNVSMEILSMGMTGDYEVAIEEGADYVRVGTGVFGERNYGTE